MAAAQEEDGGMLAIGAPLTQVEAAIKELAVDLVVANYNSPNQVVLSGRLPEIDRATALFAGRNLRGKKLQVAAAFHSPLVATASRAFRPELDHVEFAPSEMPVYANTTAAAYPSDPRAARDLLASQLAKPVNFVREVEQMYSDGVRTFVEVGPGGVLTGLVNSILSGRDFRAVALDSSSGKRGGVFDLASALAQLSASGHSIQWSQWDPRGGPVESTGGPNRLRIPICGANYVKPRAPIPPRPPTPTAFEVPPPSPVAPSSHVVPPKSRVLDVDPFQLGQPIWSEPSRQPAPLNEAPVVTAAPVAPHHVTAEPPLASSASILDADALATIRDNLRILQRIQDETARLHQRFLEGQEAALRTFESLAQRHLELTQGQMRSAERGVRSEGPEVPAAVVAPLFALQSSPLSPPDSSPFRAPSSAPEERSVEPVIPVAVAAPTLNPQPSTFNPSSSSPLRAPSSVLTSTVMSVVSEKTGYPVEMLNLSMSLDHDLGIDSIKRVEILSALQERVPNLPAFQPEELGALHTLQDVVELAEARSVERGVRSEEHVTPVVVPVPTLNLQSSTLNLQPSLRAPSSSLTSTVLAVVSEKTGYPVEMLNLGMSLDHDLGIDSIKRVEILSALQERVPNLPAFQPEELGALHTLQDVVGLAEARSAEHGVKREENPLTLTLSPPVFDSLKTGRGEGTRQVAPVAVAAPTPNPQPSTFNPPPSSPLRAPSSALTSTVLAVVSEKTGYPVEMLNLGMSLDHDLGIDSIKRVEILSALQERVPNLPAFQPEELGALHTLQDVVGLAEARSVEHGVKREENPLTLTLSPPVFDSLKTGRGEGTRQVAPVAVAVPALNPQPSTLNFPLDTLTRSIVQLVGVPPCDARPALPLARGAEVWITEDGLELSLRIAAELSERGFKPRVVNLDEPFLPTVPDRLGGLVVVAPAEGISSRQLWRAIEWLQKAGPGLRRTAASSAAVFATVSRLNGRFGFEPTRPLTDPMSGGLAGLTKSAAREWPELTCRVIDLADGWPSPIEAARAVVDELLRVGPVEIGLSAQGSCTPSVVAEKLMAPAGGPAPIQPGDLVVVSGGARGVTAEAALALARAWQPRLAILGRSPEPTREPEWLAQLATEAQIKQALIARSPQGTTPRAIDTQCKQIVAQREVAAALAKLSATGISLTYHAVDVRDLTMLRPLLAQLQREFGPVRGLIHGAGVLADGRIEDKTREQFDRVFETKVTGLRNLLGAIPPDDLRVLGLFSSYTARYGRVGQCDYAIANEVLNKLSRQFSIEHPQTHVVSFNWGPWDGGMVTGGLKQLFASEGVGLIPLAEGAELLVREFSQSTSRPVELLVIGETDAGSVSPQSVDNAAVPSELSQPSVNGSGSNIDLARVNPSGPAYQVGSSNVLLSGPSPARPYGKPPAPGTSSSWVFGGIGQATAHEPSEIKPSFERLLDVARHPFLESHVIGGKAVLPVAMIVEWLAHGAIHRNPGLELHGFDDLRIFHGVRIDRQNSATLRVLAAKPTRVEGSFQAKVQLVGNGSPAAPSAGFLGNPVGGATGLQVGTAHGREIMHAGGTVILSSGYPTVPAATLRVTPRGYSLDMATAYATRLFHGPHLHGIAAVEACSADGIVVDARTASAPWAWMTEPLRSAWLADPLALDAALQAVILWSQELRGEPCLPCSIAKYRQYRRIFPREGVRIVVQITHATDHAIRCDIEFLDHQGLLVARIDGCESVADPSLVAAFQKRQLD